MFGSSFPIRPTGRYGTETNTPRGSAWPVLGRTPGVSPTETILFNQETNQVPRSFSACSEAGFRVHLGRGGKAPPKPDHGLSARIPERGADAWTAPKALRFFFS